MPTLNGTGERGEKISRRGECYHCYPQALPTPQERYPTRYLSGDGLLYPASGERGTAYMGLIGLNSEIPVPAFLSLEFVVNG